MKKLILLFILITFNANAATVKHHFEVSLGIFDAFETIFEYGLSKDKYHINSIVETQGTMGLLYPFEAHYQSGGNIIAEKLVPQMYKYTSKSRFNQRSKELFYNKDGIATHRISTKNEKSNRVEIKKDENNLGTTDLQSVFTELALQYNTLKFCDARMGVFDGKRRYDVVFSDEGKEDFKTDHFSGQAHKCSMYIDSLGAKGDDLLWELTLNKPVVFWIMQDEASKAFFIAKVIVPDTTLGDLEVVTKKLEVND